jgi:hypothetical protein
MLGYHNKKSNFRQKSSEVAFCFTHTQYLLVVVFVILGLRVLHVDFVSKLSSVGLFVRGIHVCRMFLVIVVHTNDLPSR